MTNAYQRVLAIVNQPVHTFPRAANMEVSHYPAWFHDGAITPDFNTVDIRQTQEFPYTNAPYAICDLVPGVAFVWQGIGIQLHDQVFPLYESVPAQSTGSSERQHGGDPTRFIGSSAAVKPKSIRLTGARGHQPGPIADATAPGRRSR